MTKHNFLINNKVQKYFKFLYIKLNKNNFFKVYTIQKNNK